MHWQKSSASEQLPSTPRPYQGVRVKEPVKELLKRKRGSLQNANVATAATTTVFFPHQSLPSYSPTGQVCTDSEFVASPLPVVDDGTLYAGWLAQPTPTTLQPLTQWTAYPDYVSHEAVSCPYTGDMYVQPMCPSYTLVGTSSVLTYASQPLITNLAARPSSTPAVMPHLDMMDQQGPLNYFPWTQPISTLSAPSLQYQTAPTALPAPQFLPFPISVPEAVPQELEEPRKDLGDLSMEKLLLEDGNHGTFDLNNSLAVEGL